MSKKKIILAILIIMFAIILMTIPNKVKAVTDFSTTPMYFGINEFRNGTDPANLAYGIYNHFADSEKGVIIWEIRKYNSSNVDDGDSGTEGNFYCARARFGFPVSSEAEGKKRLAYTISYDLKKDVTEIRNSSNAMVKQIANSEYYNKLLALTDLLYLKGVSTQADRQQLLDASGITAWCDFEDFEEVALTDSDIEAVQQAAIWYYTNHDEEAFTRIYDSSSSSSGWLYYRTSDMDKAGEQYKSLDEYERQIISGTNYGVGFQRQKQAEMLYRYLISTANANASKYADGTAVPKTKVTLYTHPSVQATQPIILIEKIQETPGNYKLTLEKQDGEGNRLSIPATFSVQEGSKTPETKTITGSQEVVSKEINSSNYNTSDVYIIKETGAPAGYIRFNGSIEVTVTKKRENNTYKVDRMTYKVKDASNNEITTSDVRVELRDGNITVYVKNKQNNGQYNLTLVKQDGSGNQLSIPATFSVQEGSKTPETKTITGSQEVVSKEINSSNYNTPDVYIIKETGAPTGYIGFGGSIELTVTKINDGGNFKLHTVSWNVKDKEGNNIKGTDNDPVSVEVKPGTANIEVRVKNYQNDGKYNLTLVKEDKDGEDLTSKAVFDVDGARKEVTGRLIVAENVAITAENVNTPTTYTIKELEPPDEYCKFDGIIKVTVTKKNEAGIFKLDKVTYRVEDKEGNDITETTGETVGVEVNTETGNIFVHVKNYQKGKYNLILVKEDKNGEDLNSKAIFEVDGVRKEVTGRLTIAENVEIDAENVNTPITYTIKELEPPDEYCKFDGIIKATVIKKNENGTFMLDRVEWTVEDEEGNNIKESTEDTVSVEVDTETGNIYVHVKNYQNDGKYNLTLVKEDKNGEDLNSKAVFEVDGETKEVTGRLQIATDVEINAENVNTPTTYTIKELEPPDKYCRFDGIIKVTVTKKNEDGIYKVDKVTYKVEDAEGNDITETTGKTVGVEVNTETGNIYVHVKNYQFDLKLIKRIVEVNGVKVPERINDVDITDLANGKETTAKYDLNKDPVSVKKGDIVKYTLRVYNEGDIDGYASEITEDVPEGLEFVWSEKTEGELDADTTLTEQEKQAIKYNQLIWNFGEINKDTNKVETVTTNYLAMGKGAELTDDGANLIKAFDPSKEYKNTVNDKNPDYKEVSVYMRVISENATGTIIRNEAAITEDTDSKGKPVDDRDSDTEDWVKYEDDEDYDRVILQSFDLSLRKFIVAVSKDDKIEDSEYLKNSDGTYKRAPQVDTSKLNTTGEDGKLITTATYNHTKEPIEVAHNDYVVYMIRVYNEGDISGYASEITDHLPPYLQFVNNEFNKQYGWNVSEDGRTVKTAYLDNHIIDKTSKSEDGEILLSYKEVPIMCRVTSNAQGKITNIADITECKDENKKDILDRDSEVDNVKLPDDKDLPNYKDDESGDYIPGQQDDDDFEKLVVKTFDLALRKFITGVNDKTVTARIPQVKYDKQNNKITYEHTKDPVDVVTGDTVIYTIRVYNEGEIDGYASEITDDIPDGLQYLPENTLNKEYRWVMYDSEGKETTDINKAVKIKTDYLSKEQEEARLGENGELGGNKALLHAFDPNKEIDETNPDFAEVRVAFKVIEPNSSDRIIVNSAQISEDTDKDGNPVDDIDSTPDEWNEGEDDQDKEYIKLNYFDLALRKWVTHAIVIENGKESVTQTGHKPEDDPEQVVKVELHRKKLSSLTVKFKYSIRITNEGDIAGYAKEITDYVPEGLKFVAADNPDWVDKGNNVITTRKLENTLLQPGESADVEVVLTWINGSENMGLKTNVAEISEDYNDRHVPDRDSTPNNKVPGEDDIDDAPVLLSISTGKAAVYATLSVSVLMTLSGGIALIKKFVL